MANLAKTTCFTYASPPKETKLDKTTRIMRRITDEDAEVRHQKTARLRKARFENVTSTPAEAPPIPSGKACKIV
jgi:hypothetical protein